METKTNQILRQRTGWGHSLEERLAQVIAGEEDRAANWPDEYEVEFKAGSYTIWGNFSIWEELESEVWLTDEYGREWTEWETVYKAMYIHDASLYDEADDTERKLDIPLLISALGRLLTDYNEIRYEPTSRAATCSSYVSKLLSAHREVF